MRKFVTVVLALFILCACNTVKEDNSKGEVVIGSDQFEPFSYLENGEMKGIDVDIAKEAFKRNSLCGCSSWFTGYGSVCF